MSGRQAKRKRHEVQSVQPAAAGARRASPKVLLAGAALVVLAIAVIGLVAPRGGSPAKHVSGAAEARMLFDGVAQHGNVLGSASAPLTLVEYADLQCPYCRDFDVRMMPTLVSRYVRKGKLKVVFRPLAFVGPDSVRGRNAVIAAGLQGKLFETMELLYLNQGTENTGWLAEPLLKGIATEIPGLDTSRFLADSGSAAVARRAAGFDAQATADNVHSTPTLLVGKTGGRLRLVDEGSLAAALDGSL